MSLDVLTGIPAELVTEIILPHLPVKDILRLSLTCRALYDLTGEDKLWKERCKSDFAFIRSNLGSLVLGQPSTGGALSWKKVYGLLANGIVYGWGYVYAHASPCPSDVATLLLGAPITAGWRGRISTKILPWVKNRCLRL